MKVCLAFTHKTYKQLLCPFITSYYKSTLRFLSFNTDLPEVVRVIPNRILKLHTTRSWDFLDIKPRLVNGILSKGQSGVGSIIGVFDSGML